MRLDYKNRKPLQEEELSQKDVELSVKKTKLQLESDILATESAISDAEDEIYVIKTTYPLDTIKYVNKLAELSSLKDGLKEIQKLQKELGLD